ncbi:MAG: hypothetical protein ABIK09_10520 [Pseudomonadota bacterium]
MKHYETTCVLAVVLLACSIWGCGGGGGDGTADTAGGDTPYGKDWGLVDPEEDALDGDRSTVDLVGDQGPAMDLLPPETGCGNGHCDSDENQWTCAKDCSNPDWGALFIFAHKGDEWTSLGRIHDLLGTGASVQVVYLTSDDTPFETVYGGSKAALAPVVLGVPADHVFLYELYNEGWPLVAGPHAALDRLSTQVKGFQPAEVYLPQLGGGDLEADLAHVVGIWAVKRSTMFPQPALYEVPARSNYYLLSEPDPATAAANPNGYVDLVLQRWKLLPKDTEELKPTVGAQELAAILNAAEYILDDWMVATRNALPQDQYKYLLRTAQRFRLVPDSQDPEVPVYLSSIVNPQGTYIYEEQGWTHDEFAHLVRLVESFAGTNILTSPLHLPAFQEPDDLYIAQSFDIDLTIRNIATEEDVVSLIVGIDAVKNPTEDCQLPPDPVIPGWGAVTVTLHCKAEEEIGPHVFYIRAYSQKAADAYEPAKFAEIPYRFNVIQ